MSRHALSTEARTPVPEAWPHLVVLAVSPTSSASNPKDGALFGVIALMAHSTKADAGNELRHLMAQALEQSMATDGSFHWEGEPVVLLEERVWASLGLLQGPNAMSQTPFADALVQTLREAGGVGGAVCWSLHFAGAGGVCERRFVGG